MGLRTRACYALSRRMLKAPEARTAERGAYGDWRSAHLSASFAAFDDSHVAGRDVLDFGCGAGPLALYLAAHKAPRSIVGVDISREAIDAARAALCEARIPGGTEIRFVEGATDALPFDDRAFDTLLAFDCVEHVMQPAPILREWFRVLRPGGRCLLEWFPYKGPWGPHMESLVPIPWAHVVFGERAMFRAAERIYDLPDFVPRHWDVDDAGQKRPNKWRAWSSFEEQGYINQLDIRTFEQLALAAGFTIPRLERRSFLGSLPRRAAGRGLMSLPLIGEYFVSSVCIELERPAS